MARAVTMGHLACCYVIAGGAQSSKVDVQLMMTSGLLKRK